MRRRHTALLAGLVEFTYHATLGRTIVFSIAAWNLNCTPHITRRVTPRGVSGPSGWSRLRVEDV